jgi:hypothetical protein
MLELATITPDLGSTFQGLLFLSSSWCWLDLEITTVTGVGWDSRVLFADPDRT